MKVLRALTILSVAAAALAVPPSIRADEAVPAVGAPAPDFTLSSQEGKPVGLKNFRGKWVVLYFYPKDFTKGCTVEAHNFQSDLAKYKKKKTVILGVSVQSADSHKDFCAKEKLNFKLLADVDHAVSSAYGSTMDHDGAILSARNTFLIGPDGVIRKEFVKVDPSGHSAEVLAALDGLQAQAAKK
jgi:peroxiredoxin Q/BCP